MQNICFLQILVNKEKQLIKKITYFNNYMPFIWNDKKKTEIYNNINKKYK